MAPELVQEQPYNHSVDIWSYGIILYELFAGKPPFYTNNLYSLIKMIVKNTVKYPDNMSSEFKSFLKGLLVKEPRKRMTWPEILEHPFLRANNTEIEDQKLIRKKYNRWLRQVGQWNKDFAEFKSSKIDFFTSEVYTYDDSGFTGHNPNKQAHKKKKKGNQRDRRRKDKEKDSLSLENADETFTKLLSNKNSNLSNFLEKFSELCLSVKPKKDAIGSKLKDIQKICMTVEKMFKGAPDLFGSKKKSISLLVKQLKHFMELLREPKYIAILCHCLIVCILISEIKDVARFVLKETSWILQHVDKPELKVSLKVLQLVEIVFEKVQANFSESQQFIQELLNQRILHALFSNKKGIVSKEILNSKQGEFGLLFSGGQGTRRIYYYFGFWIFWILIFWIFISDFLVILFLKILLFYYCYK